MSAHVSGDTVMSTVESATNGKTGILYGVGVIVLPVFDAGDLSDMIIFNQKVGDGRDSFAVVCKESTAEGFQKLINAVDDPSVSSDNAKAFSVGNDTKAVLVEIGSIHTGDITDINAGGSGFSLFDLEGSAGYAIKVIAKLLCRIKRRAFAVG
jgi:hypothetical protein